jgi:serine protease Do
MKWIARSTLMVLLVNVALAPLASAVSPVLKEFEKTFVELGDRVLPTVVEIATEHEFSEKDEDSLNDLFRFFGPRGEEERERIRRRPRVAQGSGFIYDKKGHIITNNHVVDGAQKLTVTLNDGTKYDAEVVGTDPSADLAVIKIDPGEVDLPVARLADSDLLKAGQFAIAAGSPRGYTGSLSFGHISALGREGLALPTRDKLRFEGFIQTDAAINLGNSGGPLCNIDGAVIGVNIAIVYGANSIGFAIPINRVKEVAPQLIATGKVVRGWLGVSILNVEEQAELEGQEVEDFVEAFDLPDSGGVFVPAVTPGGPAEKAGIMTEDVIRKVGGIPIENKFALINQISKITPGTDVDVEIWRGGHKILIVAAIEEFPDMGTAKYGRPVLGMHIIAPEKAAELDQLKHTGDLPSQILVGYIVPDSPADNADIKMGNFIVKVAGGEVDTVEEFNKALRENVQPGKSLLLHIQMLGGKAQRRYLKVPDDFSWEE